MISPPLCSEGKEITRVPNMPLDFSVLQRRQCNACAGQELGVLLMGFEHGTFLIQQQLVQLGLYRSSLGIAHLMRRGTGNPLHAGFPIWVLESEIGWIELPCLSN